MDVILHPIMWVIAWVMYGIHSLLTAVGMPSGAGIAWVLSILGLTIVVRIIILPLYNKQINASRQSQVLQPEIRKIQAKYKGKRDAVSQRRQQEELTALYRKHGTSPFASCLPLLVQMPILFAMFRLLYAFPKIAAGDMDKLGPITQSVAEDFQNSTFFGAPLSSSFTTASSTSNPMAVRIVAIALILFMCASMFYTQRQLMMKNMPESAMDPNNPMVKTQKYMLYGMPLIYLTTGFTFQVGVMVYWFAGNVWNIGQQTWFIRNNPTPGSKAWREREKRLREKRLRQGMSEEEIAELEEKEQRGGQRYQPMSKERAKKAGRSAFDSPMTENQDLAGEAHETDEPVRGKDGLTDEERARKRYERRQAERARSREKQKERARKAKQNRQKRNF